MPFVERNRHGQVVGVYACRQPDRAEEELSEEHPEVMAFHASLPPLPKDFLKPLTKDEQVKLAAMQKIVDQDHETIRNSVALFNQSFSNLETALSALLYVVLNKPDSQIAYAIYFSATSFGARTELVSNAIIQIISENKSLSELLNSWLKIKKQIDSIARLRNAIAHGAPMTLAIGGKNYARLTPPAFDIIRIGRKIDGGEIPGLQANEIVKGVGNLLRLAKRVDHVNRLLTSFYDEDPALPDRFTALNNSLNESKE